MRRYGMASAKSIRYGYISRESAQYLGFAPANAGGGVLDTDHGYLAALPPAMHHQVVREVDKAIWESELAHAEWLQEHCGT
jgi:hypothetical protein